MSNTKLRIIKSLFFSCVILYVLWQIKIFETALDIDLTTLGIFPRKIEGFKGVLAAPVIHADFNHLLSNTSSMFFLSACIFYIYEKIAFRVIIGIYLFTGLWVWMAARPVYHIGSSGLVYGFVSFLFFSGIFRSNKQLLGLSFLLLLMYGSLIWGVFPFKSGISWEYHLLGGITGVFIAYYFKDIPIALNLFGFNETPEHEKEASVIPLYPTVENIGDSSAEEDSSKEAA